MFGCGPNFADFDPTMVRRVAIDKIWVPQIFKIQRDVLKKSWLVIFDGEVVIGFTLPYQIVGDLALGQQGIGGNIFALNVDGIKERDSGFDFVGTLNLLVGYGQGTYFFGCSMFCSDDRLRS